jgi:hypothetical protein
MAYSNDEVLKQICNIIELATNEYEWGYSDDKGKEYIAYIFHTSENYF